MGEIKGNISGIAITIEQGDMTAKKCDAYIVPQFPTGMSDMGVGSSVISAGAGRGMLAYGDYLARLGTPMDYGACCVTTSGGGNSKYLLHVASAYPGGQAKSFSTIQKAVYNALGRAYKQGIKTIAAPALGTGILGGLSTIRCAQAMMSAIHQFAVDGGSMGEFNFMILGPQEACDAFASVMQDKSFERPLRAEGQEDFRLAEWARHMRHLYLPDDSSPRR